jgi:hypothetical protein
MLDLDEVAPLVQRMWSLHMLELEKFNIIHDYMEGRIGRPSIPSSADGEIRDIWKLCVLNVLPLVLDAFVQNLSVVGIGTRLRSRTRRGGICGSATRWMPGKLKSIPTP